MSLCNSGKGPITSSSTLESVDMFVHKRELAAHLSLVNNSRMSRPAS